MNVGIYTQDEETENMLTESLSAYAEKGGRELALYAFRERESFVEKASQEPLDMFFLDMDGGESEDILTLLRLTDRACLLILCSRRIETALAGYRVGARDFLHLPCGSGQVIDSFVRVSKCGDMEKDRSLSLRVNGAWSHIAVDDIMYVESEGHNLLFYLCSGGRFAVSGSLKQYWQLLDVYANFLRCHQSYILNLDYVKEIKNEYFVLQDSGTISVSRRYRKEARIYYSEYLRRKLC